MNTSLIQQLKAQFEIAFAHPPALIIKAPGRINLIGEHTDYNMGYVLPGAIDQAIYVAIAHNTTEWHQLHALDLEEEYQVKVGHFEVAELEWANFVIGAIQKMEDPITTGLDIMISSDLPIGAGLSSSSALTCGVLLALDQLFEIGEERQDLAFKAQSVERDFIGLQGGVMDQHASLLGKKDNLLFLDCRNNEYDLIPFHLEDYQLILINTNVSHNLTDSEYNTRSAESRKATEILSEKFKEVKSLREATSEMVGTCIDEMGESLAARASFVIDENNRVLQMIEAMTRQDIEVMGHLLFESHDGLRDQYDVSCEELDFLVFEAMEFPGVIGARMMGGGFGGCTINLIEKEAASSFQLHILKQYQNEYGIAPTWLEVTISDGAKVVWNLENK